MWYGIYTWLCGHARMSLRVRGDFFCSVTSKKEVNVFKRSLVIGALMLIPFGSGGHAFAGKNNARSLWNSEIQICAARDAQEICTKWIYSVNPELINVNALNAQGSLCDDQLVCKTEALAYGW